MDDLFNMLDENKDDYMNKHENFDNNNSYKIEKKQVRKLYAQKKIKIDKKKFVAFGLGSIMIFSGINCLKNEKNSNKEMNLPNNSVVLDNEFMNKKRISADKINNALMYEPEYYKSENTSSYKKANFTVGNNSNIQSIIDFKETERYKIIEKYSNQYGVDPQVMLAIAFKESSLEHEACSPDGTRYNNCAIGMMQLEKKYDGKDITAYNYETNQYDTIKYTLDNVKDYDTNVKIACMMFQTSLEKYKGNIYMAIQSHNYGEYMMNIIISETANDKKINVDVLMENPFDVDWTNYLEEIHSNPKKYLDNWNYETYGDPNYLKTVISLCTDNNVDYIYDGDSYSFDLTAGFKRKQENAKNR